MGDVLICFILASMRGEVGGGGLCLSRGRGGCQLPFWGRKGKEVYSRWEGSWLCWNVCI